MARPAPTKQSELEGFCARLTTFTRHGEPAMRCPPRLPESFLAEVHTWLSAAHEADRHDLLERLLTEIHEQLEALTSDFYAQR